MTVSAEPQTGSFEDLSLIQSILRTLQEEGYDIPTPIQEQAIPHMIAGRDLLGRAQTGSGKTAAFALPIIQRFASMGPPKRGTVRALVLAPTRELAVQISESFESYSRHSRLLHVAVHGGVSQNPQVTALKKGVDVLVATPGRLLDLYQQKHVRLDDVEVVVLDEADRMLDMGFIPDVRRILALMPNRKQSVMFSATMPQKVAVLSNEILTDPVEVNLTPKNTTADNIDQKVMFVERENKRQLLGKMLMEPGVDRALVFTRTKHRADSVMKALRRDRVSCEAIHGDRPQSARQRALDDFRAGRTKVLIATDVASRGIDVDNITHVFNFELPDEAEAYIHRIGRTARAGAAGVAYSFCSVEEWCKLTEIEKLIQRPLEIVSEHPFRSSVPFIRLTAASRTMRRGGRQARLRTGRAPRFHV